MLYVFAAIAKAARVSGAGGHVRGEDVVRVTVEVLAGPTWRMVVRGSACRAAIWTSRRSTPASKLVVTKVCLSIWGCGLVIGMLTCCASCRRRRVAACRSIRAPRLFSRIGPRIRPSVARSMARPTAGRQRHQDDLAALAAHAKDTVTVFFTQVANAGAGGFEDPQAQQPEHGYQREVIPVRGLARGGQQGLELQMGESEYRRLGR